MTSIRPATAPIATDPTDDLRPDSVLKTLLVIDLVDSTQLVEQLGDRRASELFTRHDRLARDLLAEHEGLEIDKTDGFLLLFERPLRGVRYALDYHQGLAALGQEQGIELSARVGIHLGEVFLRHNPAEDVARGAKPIEVEGLAKPMVARLMSLAGGRQTLLTRGAFDVARRAAVGDESLAESLRWLAHGEYLFKGLDEPVGIFEVGLEGFAPLARPADSQKARRAESRDAILGWRPAAGQEVAKRPHWELCDKLGEGGFGEVWLAQHRKTSDRRVFKFCFDAKRLRTLQREITLFRLLRGELGERDDIARILDWSFDSEPYFIESEYTAGGSLIDWAEAEGGIAKVPLDKRLVIVAQVAEALSAAHSVGVLHKDVKPGNVLIHTDTKGRVQARLADFGIGGVTDEERLASAGITVLGMTRAGPESTTPGPASGTELYRSPELLEGKSATLQADIYALGVMLYQMVVGDLFRALGPGWERGVDDELLREDIAFSCDIDPEKRLGNALRLAERLRSLEARRAQRERERRTLETAERTRAALKRSRRQRKVAAAILVSLLLFGAVVTTLWRRSETALLNSEVSKLLVLGRLELSPDPREYCPSTGLAYAIAAIERIDSHETRWFALEALWRGPTGFALGSSGEYYKPFTADGSWLVHADADGIRAWPRSGTVPSTIPVDLAHFPGAWYLRGTPDPDVIEVGVQRARPVEFWSLSDRSLLRTFTKDSTCEFVQPTGVGTLICLGQSGLLTEVRELPLRHGEPRVLGSLESASVDGATVSGRSLVTFSGRTLRLHDVDRLDLEARIIGEHDSSIASAYLYGSSNTLLSADQSGAIRVWSLTTTGGELVGEYQGPPGLTDISVDPQLRSLAVANRPDGTVWLRDLSGPPDAEPQVLHRKGAKQMVRASVESKGQWVAASGRPGGLMLWPLQRKHPFVLSRQLGKVWDLAFHPDGRSVVTGSADGTVSIWPLDPAAGEARTILFRARRGFITTVDVDPKGRWVLAGSVTGPWLIPLDGGPPRKLPGFDGWVWAVALSPDGRYAAGGGGHDDSSERVIRIWDLQTEKEVRVLGPPDRNGPGGAQIIRLLYTPDGGRLISSSWSGVLVWDLMTGTHEYLGDGLLPAVADHGKTLFAAWSDWDELGGAGVYDLETGAMKELSMHGRAGSIALSPDETVVVTGGIDGPVRVGPADGGEPHLLLGHKGYTLVKVSPDGRWIASGSTDGTLRLWPMPDISRRPMHTLPRDDLLAKLKSLSNFRAVEDDAAPDGYRIEAEPFAGWGTVPDW